MTTKAQPGDIIKIDDPASCIHGNEYLVVERPLDAKSGEGKVWVKPLSYPDRHASWIESKFVIISYDNTVSETVGNDVDAFLDKQRDNNLKRAFGFE